MRSSLSLCWTGYLVWTQLSLFSDSVCAPPFCLVCVSYDTWPPHCCVHTLWGGEWSPSFRNTKCMQVYGPVAARSDHWPGGLMPATETDLGLYLYVSKMFYPVPHHTCVLLGNADTKMQWAASTPHDRWQMPLLNKNRLQFKIYGFGNVFDSQFLTSLLVKLEKTGVNLGHWRLLTVDIEWAVELWIQAWRRIWKGGRYGDRLDSG